MGGIELKADSLQRWVIYSKETYESGRIFLTTEQKKAVAEGKKFSQGAYADCERSHENGHAARRCAAV